jgi:opacity protein-like surface antigen
MRSWIIFFLALTSVTAQASKNGFYTGAGVGVTNLKVTFNIGPNVAHDIDDEILGAQFFVGYHISNHWSVEGGYTYFGENDADNLSFLESPLLGPPFNLEVEIDGYYLNGQYHFRPSDDTSIDLMLGVIRGDATAKNTLCCGVLGSGTAIGQVSEDEYAPMVGVGLTVDMTEQWALRINWNYYDLDLDNTIEAPWRIGLDLIWDF